MAGKQTGHMPAQTQGLAHAVSVAPTTTPLAPPPHEARRHLGNGKDICVRTCPGQPLAPLPNHPHPSLSHKTIDYSVVTTHHNGTIAGKLNGQMPAHTPSGWRMV